MLNYNVHELIYIVIQLCNYNLTVRERNYRDFYVQFKAIITVIKNTIIFYLIDAISYTLDCPGSDKTWQNNSRESLLQNRTKLKVITV